MTTHKAIEAAKVTLYVECALVLAMFVAALAILEGRL